MSLVRPQGSLEGRGEQEQTLETTILSELGQVNRTVAEIAERQKFTHVMLFSGEFGGMHHEGKLPELAAQIAALVVTLNAQDLRIKKLEEDRIRREAAEKAATRTSAKIGAVVGAVSGLTVSLLALLVDWLRK